MKKIKFILGIVILISSVCKSQTVNLVAESKSNLCLLNHEVIESPPTYTTFTTEKIAKAMITPDPYPEAAFVANNLGKLLIATNTNSFSSPQYVGFQVVLTRPKLNFGNVVVADLNNDGLDDMAASNSYGDVYTCRRFFPSLFYFDSIPLTLTSGGHHARLYLANMNNDPLPELLTIGAYTTNPFCYRFGLYTNTSTTATTLSFTALSSGTIAAASSSPNDNFSACTADLNNDNKDEVLFVSDVTSSSITILYSSTSGNLDLKTSFDLGVPNLVNKKIRYADINSDGIKEVILYGIVNSNINFIYIYSANFTGNNPSAPVLQKVITLPGQINDFDFADMNKDTLMDLVTSVAISPSPGDINVFLAQDAGLNFASSPIPFTQTFHMNGGLAIMDVDNNKSADIISFSTNTISSISILKNYTYRDTLFATPSKTILCAGESVTLTTNLKGYGLGYYSTYSPVNSLPAISQTLLVNSAGVYSTTATYSTFLTFPTYPAASSSCGVISNTIQIRMGITPTISVNAPSSLCLGQTATISASGATSYTWSTGDNTPLIVATPTAAFAFYVTGSSADGCVGSGGADTIYIHSSPNASITADKTLLCKNERATFVATGGQVYLWSTGQSTPTISITQTVNVPQTYTVLVDAGGGCVKVVSVQTVFNDNCNEVVIKNGITPNGDGSNDFLYIENIDRYPNNQVNIFNRWGAELYSAKGYNNDTNVWPNTSVKLSPGTYYYIVDLGNGDPVRKGWLEILSN